MFGIENCSVP